MSLLLLLIAMFAAATGLSAWPLALVARLALLEGAFFMSRLRGDNRAAMLARPDDMRRVGDDDRERGNSALRGSGLHSWMRGGRG